MKVKPAGPDRAVPYPGTNTLLPQEGAVVPENTYWRRRLRDGDVVLMDDKPVNEHPQPPVVNPLIPPRRP